VPGWRRPRASPRHDLRGRLLIQRDKGGDSRLNKAELAPGREPGLAVDPDQTGKILRTSSRPGLTDPAAASRPQGFGPWRARNRRRGAGAGALAFGPWRSPGSALFPSRRQQRRSLTQTEIKETLPDGL